MSDAQVLEDAVPSPSAALSEWLEYIERVHPRTIEMGLERVSRVRDALRLAPSFPVFTVGGTNGKGSACMLLEAILSACCGGKRR